MPLLSVVLCLVVVGLVLYLIERFIPMDEAIKVIIRVVVVIAIIIWLLQGIGATSGPHLVWR